MYMSLFHLLSSNVHLFKLCGSWVGNDTPSSLLPLCFFVFHFVYSFTATKIKLGYISSLFSSLFSLFFCFIWRIKSIQCSSFLKHKNFESCESSVYTSSWCVPKCHCGDKVMIHRATTDNTFGNNFWDCLNFKVSPNFNLIYVQMW